MNMADDDVLMIGEKKDWIKIVDVNAVYVNSTPEYKDVDMSSLHTHDVILERLETHVIAFDPSDKYPPTQANQLLIMEALVMIMKKLDRGCVK